ncbi:MAG: hypothetical protein DME72_07940 [Verrucomicrobia bacterium]|nr:MAG: hypothetical protein DME72_07940 [Verrucomicrobiota bacterium]
MQYRSSARATFSGQNARFRGTDAPELWAFTTISGDIAAETGASLMSSATADFIFSNAAGQRWTIYAESLCF